MDFFLPFIFVILALVLSLSAQIGAMHRKLKAMDRRLQELARHAGLPEPDVNAELRRLMGDGKAIEAIKLARAELGLGLQEAKEYVEQL